MKNECSRVPQNSNTLNGSPKYSNTGHLRKMLQHSWIALSEHAALCTTLRTYAKYITAVMLIALLQVEEDQEVEEIDCDELLVGDENDGADWHAMA